MRTAPCAAHIFNKKKGFLKRFRKKMITAVVSKYMNSILDFIETYGFAKIKADGLKEESRLARIKRLLPFSA
jgi:hypothetical protein